VDPGSADADALRDMLALVRAALDDDYEAMAAVAANMSCPELTAGALAEWIAEWMQDRGTSRDVLDDWQREKGLA
jgi:hypothetical protein